jgi:hypothetical protein
MMRWNQGGWTKLVEESTLNVDIDKSITDCEISHFNAR